MSTITLPGWATLVDRMIECLSVPDGGFTIRPATGERITGGYAVSVYPHRETIVTGNVQPGDLIAYMIDNDDLLADDDNAFGGWRDPESGMAFLDVSIVVDSREAALFLARQYGQRAVFDFTRMVSVPVD